MQNIIITLLTCSVTMSALGLFYMAISPLMQKRYSEKGCYYAWLIIVAGLIIPFRPQWNNAIVRIDLPNIAHTIHPGGEVPILDGTQVFNVADNIPVGDTAFFLAPGSVSYWQFAAVVWLAGVLVFLLYHAIKHYRFTKLAMRWSERITDERTLALLQSLKIEMGISKKISLYQCLDMGSPAMFGFVNPRILLPKVELADDELRFILKHELVHFKRKDLYYKCLVLIATAIHWFNPIVYLIARAIEAQCELSCDAEIVRNTDADTRQQYSETIIGVVKCQSRLKTALSTNFYGGKKGMKNRISSIMDTGKKKTGMVIVCMFLVVTLGTGFVFAANANTIEPVENAVNVYVDNEYGAVYITPQKAEQKATQFEVYREFGLTYDQAANNLYYNGELVRYFEDMIPLSDGNPNVLFGIDHLDLNGTVDVLAVRDFSQIIHNPDGTTDTSGKLLGLERVSQMEFDSRDINKFRIPSSQNAVIFPSNAINEGIEVSVVNSDEESVSGTETNTYVEATVVHTDNGGVPYSQTQGYSVTEMLLDKLEEYGITFDENISHGGRGNIYYNGQLVRTLIDETNGGGTWISSFDKSGNIDVRTIRDNNGNLRGFLMF